MGVDSDSGIDWFLNGVVRDLRNGALIRFWQDVWVGTASLMVVFPRLYAIFEQKGLKSSEG